MPDTRALPTLEAGFTARRAVRLPLGEPGEAPNDEALRLKAMFDLLTEKALENTGVTVYLPVSRFDLEEHWPVAKPAALTVVRMMDVTSNAALLGDVDRREAYRAIRAGVPSFNSRMPTVTVPAKGGCRIQGKYPRQRTLLGQLENASQLGHERYGMSSVLARLAGVPVEELNWSNHMPHLRLAEFAEGVPSEVSDGMADIIRQHAPFDLNLLKGHLFPYVREHSHQPRQSA